MSAVFRCDATQESGFGHLSRCLALAEGLRCCGIESTLAGHFDGGAKALFGGADLECQPLSGPINSPVAELEFASLLSVKADAFVVVDSYRIDDQYLARLKATGRQVVVFDDFAALEAYPCDVVVNFTIAAGSLAYPAGPLLLLGPDYLPARRSLVTTRPASLARTREGPVRNLLIAVGGADPRHIAARLVHALRSQDSRICIHVVGNSDPGLARMLENFADGSTVVPRQPDLSEQFLWADAALTGGGLIKYECAFMGVPVAAIAQNEGQDAESKGLAEAGLMLDLGLVDCIGDEELAGLLDAFISDTHGRGQMAERMRHAFPPDPTAHTARRILEALGR